MHVNKSFYFIGIYDPKKHDSWPWHCHYDDGQYLSAKKRICSKVPAEFETENEAREFFHSWKHKAKYKMELIEVKKWVDIPDPVYPDDHPRSILDKIVKNEKSRFGVIAALWFSGADVISQYSRPTQLKYQKELLKYDIDLFSKPTDKIKNQWKNSHYTNYCDFEFKELPKLKVIHE